MGAQLFRVVVPVVELDHAVRFYQRLLLVDGKRLSPAWHYFQFGSVMLACHDAEAEGEPPLPPSRQPSYVAVDEPLVQLRLRAQQIGAQGIEPEARRLPTGETGFMLSDPCGNQLCLVDSYTMQWEPRTTTAAAKPVASNMGVLVFQQEFLNAVKGGEFARVKELLALDPDLLDVTDSSGASVLLLAAYKRHERIAAYLMALREELTVWEAAAMGASTPLAALLRKQPQRLNEPAPDGFRPLGLACFFGQDECIELLLRLGADANAVSRNQLRVRPLNSVLTQMPQDRALAIVHRLLYHRAEPNAAQVGGHTPLHQAASRGFAEVVDLLLAAGANPAARADNGATAVDLARVGRHEPVLERIRSYQAADRRGEPQAGACE